MLSITRSDRARVRIFPRFFPLSPARAKRACSAGVESYFALTRARQNVGAGMYKRIFIKKIGKLIFPELRFQSALASLIVSRTSFVLLFSSLSLLLQFLNAVSSSSLRASSSSSSHLTSSSSPPSPLPSSSSSFLPPFLALAPSVP